MEQIIRFITWKFIFGVIGILVLVYATYYYFNPLGPKIRIHDTEYAIEIALTPEQITRGLSYRKSMDLNQGMLFVFQDKLPRSFWMYEMNFPLDIIWIEDTTVVGIESNLPYPKNGEKPVSVTSPNTVNRVLELNAGSAATLNLKIGDTVTYLAK